VTMMPYRTPGEVEPTLTAEEERAFVTRLRRGPAILAPWLVALYVVLFPIRRSR
jgi:hypothetical protein